MKKDFTSKISQDSNGFVQILDPTIENIALFEAFTSIGEVASPKVATDGSGKSKGYGFVAFNDATSAAKAISNINGVKIGESVVQVCKFEARETSEENPDNFTNLYVKNIPEHWDEAKLQAQFTPIGSVKPAIVMTDASFCEF